MAPGLPIVSPTALDKDEGDFSKAPCGTGPFKLKDWNPGEAIVLETNGEYWNEDNASCLLPDNRSHNSRICHPCD